LGGLASNSVLYHQGDSVVNGSGFDHPVASVDFETERIAFIPTQTESISIFLVMLLRWASTVLGLMDVASPRRG
jgi:hypothetical protein